MKNPITLLILVLSISLISCKKDDPPPFTPPPTFEHGVITSAVVQFTDDNTGNSYTWQYSDPDGDGGNPPLITADTLPANTVFSVNIELFNELEDPVENVTPEIQDEAEDHQFFFLIDNSLQMEFKYADMDSDGLPIGLSNTATTANTSNGNVTVILRHFPDKTGENVAEGVIDNAGGGTDLEVNFFGVIW